MLDAAIAQHGPTHLVEQLRACVDNRLRERAIFLMSAIVRCTGVNDQIALARADAASVLVTAIAANPRDRLTVCASLGALDKCWPSEVANDEPTTRRIAQCCIDAIAGHADLHVHQAAVRLLKLHSLSNQNLVMAVEAIEALQRATRAFPADDTIQFWAAQGCVGYCSIEPDDVISTHGQSGFDRLRQASIAIAVAAPHPTELLIGDRPWNEVILSLYPRLRSQAQRAAQ